MAMQDTVEQGASNRLGLVDLINQFYSNPSMLQESRQVVDAQANQAFDAVTGQFRNAEQQNAFSASRQGLGGGSFDIGRGTALRGQFGQAMSGVEAARQSLLAQAQMQQQQQHMQALQQAMQVAPLQQQTLAAQRAQVGGQIGAAQLQGQSNALNQQLQMQGSQDLAQSIAQPLNILAYMQQLQGIQNPQSSRGGA